MYAKHLYPPELFELMVEAIACLFKSKRGVLTFFRGAGVHGRFTQDLETGLRNDRDSIYKVDISRTVLLRLNDSSERYLRELREILKRVCEFEDFSTCWPEDQQKARGLVAEIRAITNKHDFFRKLERQHEDELKKHRESARQEAESLRQLQSSRRDILQRIKKLIVMEDPHEKGRGFEQVINDLFKTEGISLEESFTLPLDKGHGTKEQIDGAIKMDGHIYLVEMKWHKAPIGVEHISRHINRLAIRSECRGLIVSYSNFTEPAVEACREAIRIAPIILCSLKEIVLFLEGEGMLEELLTRKFDQLILKKQPFLEIS